MHKACKRSLTVYFTALVLLLVWFWVGIGATDGLLYSFAAYLFILPVLSFAVSLICGRRGSGWRFALPVLCAAAAPAMDFCTYRLIAFVYGHALHPPYWSDAPRLFVCSLIGLLLGQLLRIWDKRRTAN